MASAQDHLSYVRAHFKSGHNLLSDMDIPGETSVGKEMAWNALEALGYITGVFDLGSQIFFQPPGGIVQGQLRQVVIKYLKDHPESLHRPAADLVMEAFQSAWPMR
jgi:hypothetical protein